MSETAVKSVIGVDNMQYSTREEQPTCITIASSTGLSGHQHDASSGIEGSEANYSVHPQQIGFIQARGDHPPANVGYPPANVGYNLPNNGNPPMQIGFPNVGYNSANAACYYTPNVGTHLPAVAYSHNPQNRPNQNVMVVQQPRVTIPNDYGCYSTCVCLLCFTPLSLLAMIYSKMCRDDIRKGNMTEAKEKSRIAKALSTASLVIWICGGASLGIWYLVEKYALSDPSMSTTRRPYYN